MIGICIRSNCLKIYYHIIKKKNDKACQVFMGKILFLYTKTSCQQLVCIWWEVIVQGFCVNVIYASYKQPSFFKKKRSQEKKGGKEKTWNNMRWEAEKRREKRNLRFYARLDEDADAKKETKTA